MVTETDNDLEISHKFQPLFEILEGDHHSVDTVILTGGRFSSKSHTVSIFSLTALVNYYWNILYTRFTNVSIGDSIKTEVSGKIEALGLEPYVVDTINSIETADGKNRISFKGIKTGSKGQTANLKSLSGFNCFIVDEAEEIPDYKTFKKVYYSIRSKDKRNISILILNPTTKEHWIYQEYFEKHEIPDGFCGIHKNVLYIHTSYLDVNPIFIPDNILRDYKELAEDNPDEYDNVVMGGWLTDAEGVLLPMSSLKFADLSNIPQDNIVYRFAVGDPADKGGDHFSIPIMHVAVIDNQISCFVKDCIHSKEGIEVVNDRLIFKLRENYIEDVYLEANGVGLAAYMILKKDVSNHASVKPFTVTIPKETRILSNYEFVKKYFVFDSSYKTNPEYYTFLKHVTGYEREGDNKHKKDAIDSLASAANILKIKYKKLLYG